MKWLKRAGWTVLILAVVLVLTLNYALGPLVKAAVEKAAPGLLGVPVTIEKTHFRLLQGRLQLEGFVMGNPEGYKTDHAIRVGQLLVEFDLMALFRDPLVIRKVHVKAPEVIYEVGLGHSNIGTVLERLEAMSEEEEPDPSGKRVIIEDFRVEDARVRLSAKLAMGASLPIPLPDIHLTDIGKETEKKGTTPLQAVRKMFGALARGVAGAVTGSVEAIGDGAKAVGSAVGKGVGKVATGVKNLIGMGDSETETNAPPAEPGTP